MAHNVTIDIATTKQSFPTSIQFNSIFVVLSPAALGEDIFGAGNDVRSAFSAPYSVTFENVSAGDYNITMYTRDSNGSPLGAKITGFVTVAEDAPAATPGGVEVKPESAEFDVPVAFTVTVS
jgi:hypothetical protein